MAGGKHVSQIAVDVACWRFLGLASKAAARINPDIWDFAQTTALPRLFR
jgi:hypothetical protein